MVAIQQTFFDLLANIYYIKHCDISMGLQKCIWIGQRPCPQGVYVIVGKTKAEVTVKETDYNEVRSGLQRCEDEWMKDVSYHSPQGLLCGEYSAWGE